MSCDKFILKSIMERSSTTPLQEIFLEMIIWFRSIRSYDSGVCWLL